MLYFVYGFSLILSCIRYATHISVAYPPLFSPPCLRRFREWGRKKLFGSDFLKCFIDIFIYINFVATPRNKIKHELKQLWVGKDKKEKKLWQIVRLFWPFITCPVLSKTSLNYYFFLPAPCKRLSVSIMCHKHVLQDLWIL